ncbi:hypothetical protein [Singulisphaera sp. PoT]|uniref:hypothetical protein n=1 Tax=Singulisphaera sp. PoT TaxID=3411797 RepID=UPI003BF4E23D
MTISLGTVTLNLDGDVAIADFSVDGTWTFHGEEWVADLLKMHAALVDTRDRSPSLGPYGPSILNELARRCGGTAHHAKLPGPPPGTVY